MSQYKLNINGASKTVNVASNTPLLWVLRDHLHLVGTKFGCGVGQCGACTVHLDGEPARACQTPIEKVGKSQITTIEGLHPHNEHPLQTVWQELDVPQCGYCQAGQIMAAAALLKKFPSLRIKTLTLLWTAICAAVALTSTFVRTSTKPQISAEELA